MSKGSPYHSLRRLLKSPQRIASRLLDGVAKKKNLGYCPVCRKQTLFIAYTKWLRDSYRCIRCFSIPRQRALLHALDRFFPDWSRLSIHESSPGGISLRFIKPRCANYTYSQYFPDITQGTDYKGVRCENLAALTFPDESFDLFITQDVFEHVFEAEKAFSEIYRVLKPGGAHVFTMPWYPQLETTVLRAEMVNGQLVHHLPAMYHKNPVDDTGSLVVRDWGKDFTGFVRRCSGLETMVYLHKDRRLGLDAEHLEVFISFKNPPA